MTTDVHYCKGYHLSYLKRQLNNDFVSDLGALLSVSASYASGSNGAFVLSIILFTGLGWG